MNEQEDIRYRTEKVEDAEREEEGRRLLEHLTDEERPERTQRGIQGLLDAAFEEKYGKREDEER